MNDKETAQQRYRAKLKLEQVRLVQIKISGEVYEVLARFGKFTNGSMSEIVGDILETWAIDTREVMPKLEEWSLKREEMLSNKKGK